MKLRSPYGLPPFHLTTLEFFQQVHDHLTPQGVVAVNAARELRLEPVILDAQVQVIPFYEKLGFVAEGPVFDDAGIPHRRMTLKKQEGG